MLSVVLNTRINAWIKKLKERLDNAITYHFLTGFLYEKDDVFSGFYLSPKFHHALSEFVKLQTN